MTYGPPIIILRASTWKMESGLIMANKPKLSATKLAPCVCGGGEVRYGFFESAYYANKHKVECRCCPNAVAASTRSTAQKMWNAAMRGLSMEGKDK